MVLLSVNFDYTVMMRSDLSTFLPTLELYTKKKHYSKDLWHCTSNQNSVCALGCLEPAEGIKKVLTSPKEDVGVMNFFHTFSLPPKYFLTGGLKLHKMHTIRKLSKRDFF